MQTNTAYSTTVSPAQAERPLAGRTAVVTGSTSGIGLGIARSLAANGANIMLNGFGPADDIETLREKLAQDAAVDVLYSGADLSVPDEVLTLVDTAVRAFGQVDILVNNAGIQHVAPIEAFPVQKWDAIMALNLSAAFHATRAAMGGMKERRWGRIVNIASAHGLVASPFKSAYVAAKHGLVGLTKVAALEGAEYGVTCNAVCPGYVWTPLVEKQIDDQAAAHNISRDAVIRDVLLAQQPNKQFTRTDELGALVAFLCSTAAQTVTGSAIPVDGGWTAH